LVARSGDKLAQVADELQRQFGIAVKTIALDLSQALAPHFLFDQLRRERISIDILINNAGYGRFGEFAELPLEESLGQIQLNVLALTALTRLFVGPMLERRSGKILNVASTAGFQPGPLMAVYYATKAYVISFSEALANELKRIGVTVTCLCPGVTDTEFQKRAGTEQTPLFRQMRPMDAKTVAGRLSRFDERQAVGDFRIQKLAVGGVTTRQSEKAGYSDIEALNRAIVIFPVLVSSQVRIIGHVADRTLRRPDWR